MVDRDGTIFKFLFSIILFNSTGETKNAHISTLQLHYTKNLQTYLESENTEKPELAAVRLGTAMEFIARLSE